jgi:hypothetical protein
MTKTQNSGWIALDTFEGRDGTFYEAGGIYDHEPQCSYGESARPFDPTEHVAACPRCGQLFVATPAGTAEDHRDLHFDGDADIPSICRHLPARRLQLLSQ